MVHSLASLQVMVVPRQEPAEHLSPVLQALASLQTLVLLVKTQPEAGLQVSLVQPLESLQVTAVPAQVPAAQTSPDVQALASLQATVLLVKTQPVAGLQESVVQTLESSQVRAGPPVQMPAAQTSRVVQALPSSQEPLRAA